MSSNSESESESVMTELYLWPVRASDEQVSMLGALLLYDCIAAHARLVACVLFNC